MELQIDIAISDFPSGGQFRLSDRVAIPNADFMVMSGILARFHDLLTEIKAAQDAAAREAR